MPAAETSNSRGAAWIAEQAEKKSPFFLYLSYTAPHFPVQPHPEWEGRSRFGEYGDAVELP